MADPSTPALSKLLHHFYRLDHVNMSSKVEATWAYVLAGEDDA